MKEDDTSEEMSPRCPHVLTSKGSARSPMSKRHFDPGSLCLTGALGNGNAFNGMASAMKCYLITKT